MDVPRRKQAGWIEVITGSMFSGKSEELIRRLRRAQIARQKVQIFKPTFDDRYSDDHIVSHSDMRIASANVANSKALLAEVADDAEVVGIDEGQFFDADLPAVCNELANRGKRVIVAGLDQDYLGKPFEPMPQLLAVAEYITKTLAICMVCGNPANHTQRLVASQDRVLLGAQGTYEARCRGCFDPALGLGARSRLRSAGDGSAAAPLRCRVPGRQPVRPRAAGALLAAPPHGAPDVARAAPGALPAAGRHRRRVGLLLVYNLLLRPGAADQAFGVGMMFVYYAGIVPLSVRIERGFYRDGVWSERRFVRYRHIGALTWREEPGPVLLLAFRNGRSAVRLAVPGSQFGAVRRVLRDLIGRHVINLEDAGLHLGFRDEREDV